MTDDLAGLLIESLLKLVNRLGELLNRLSKFGIHQDMCDEGVELHHFSQYAEVTQAFHGLLNDEVEWNIFDKQFKVSVVHP